MISKYYHHMYRNEFIHWWYYGRRLFISLILKSHTSPMPLNLLDVGCGTGSTLMVLKEFGKVYGIDNNAQAIKYCKARGFNQVQLASSDTIPYKKNYFDVITCLDVLEHIEDEKKTLLEIKRVLKKSGIFVIFVPANKLLWSDLDKQAHHHRRYSYTDLKKVLLNSGFNILKISHFNYIFFAPILIIRLIQKSAFGKYIRSGYGPKAPNKLVNYVCKYIFILDIYSTLLFNPPFGVSLYAICTKGKSNE